MIIMWQIWGRIPAMSLVGVCAVVSLPFDRAISLCIMLLGVRARLLERHKRLDSAGEDRGRKRLFLSHVNACL